MRLNKENAELFVPDGEDAAAALARTTCLGIGAHQDDLELMSAHAILECFGRQDKWYSAVIVTDGAGSARAGAYADYTDAQMQRVRRQEQKKAAYIGEYGAVALLDYTSAEVKDSANNAVAQELAGLIDAARPQAIYTHNLADKHPTHVAVAIRTIQAIRSLPKAARPAKLVGCEVWRSLDWMNDDEKCIFDMSGHDNLESALAGVYDSQIAGGKRYDLAARGRRTANATYFESHSVDKSASLAMGMDLTPLIQEDDISIEKYVLAFIERFSGDVANKIRKLI